MNPALALLLSRVFDGALAPDHQVDLGLSGLTTETIQQHYIRSVPPAMVKVLFPFRSPAGGFLDHVRMKIFPSLIDSKGHTTKYLGPKGAPPRLYFCVPSLPDVLESDRPVWLVEGAKKALATAQLGLPAVGIEGIEGWHTKGSTALLPDFDAIPLRGRIVELVPDGDWRVNRDVDRGVRRLGQALLARGARPRLVVFPPPTRFEPVP